MIIKRLFKIQNGKLVNRVRISKSAKKRIYTRTWELRRKGIFVSRYGLDNFAFYHWVGK